MADKGNHDHNHDQGVGPQECGCCKGESRRTALTKLGAGLLGAAGLAAVSGCPGGSTYSKEGHGPGGQATSQATSLDVDAKPGGIIEFHKFQIRPGTAEELVINGERAYIIQHHDTNLPPQDRWRALSRICTHNRCLVSYVADKLELHCPCHGSKFDFDGNPIAGPARLRLKRWEITEGPQNVTIETSTYV
jgi:Rieske Fe-S protein